MPATDALRAPQGNLESMRRMRSVSSSCSPRSEMQKVSPATALGRSVTLASGTTKLPTSTLNRASMSQGDWAHQQTRYSPVAESDIFFQVSDENSLPPLWFCGRNGTPGKDPARCWVFKALECPPQCTLLSTIRTRLPGRIFKPMTLKPNVACMRGRNFLELLPLERLEGPCIDKVPRAKPGPVLSPCRQHKS